MSLARTRERGAECGFAARSRVLARLARLAQIGELARRLEFHFFSSFSKDKMTTNTSGGSRPSDKGDGPVSKYGNEFKYNLVLA